MQLLRAREQRAQSADGRGVSLEVKVFFARMILGWAVRCRLRSLERPRGCVALSASPNPT